MNDQERIAAHDKLLGEWEQRALLALIAYNRAASRCRTWSVLLTVLTAVLAAFVGTAVFASLETQRSTEAKIIVGCVSVLVAALTGVNSSLGFPARIDAYERAARRFAHVRRHLEEARLDIKVGLGSFDELSKTLRSNLDEAADDSPNAPRLSQQVTTARQGSFHNA